MRNQISKFNFFKKPELIASAALIITAFTISAVAFNSPPVGCTPDSCDSPLVQDYTNQRVGIGTSSPSSTLQIGDATAKESLTIDGAGAGWTAAEVILKSNHGFRGTGLFTYNSANLVNWFIGNPYYGGGPNTSDAFGIFRKTGAQTQQTADWDNALMSISNGGLVGIGTVSPGQRLTVQGKIRVQTENWEPRGISFWNTVTGSATTCTTSCGNGYCLGAYSNMATVVKKGCNDSGEKVCICIGRP